MLAMMQALKMILLRVQFLRSVDERRKSLYEILRILKLVRLPDPIRRLKSEEALPHSNDLYDVSDCD